MTPETSLLERILWSQVVRLVHESPLALDSESASARAIRGVLQAAELHADE